MLMNSLLNKIFSLVLLLTLSGFTSSLYAAGDIAKGKAKSAMCMACHGPKGISAMSMYPNLAGQKEQYLISSLKAYKLGQRKGGMSSMMTPMAKPLSDQDINNLAAYYSSLQ